MIDLPVINDDEGAEERYAEAAKRWVSGPPSGWRDRIHEMILLFEKDTATKYWPPKEYFERRLTATAEELADIVRRAADGRQDVCGPLVPLDGDR